MRQDSSHTHTHTHTHAPHTHTHTHTRTHHTHTHTHTHTRTHHTHTHTHTLPYKFYLMVHSKDETARHKSDFRFSKSETKLIFHAPLLIGIQKPRYSVENGGNKEKLDACNLRKLGNLIIKCNLRKLSLFFQVQ